MLSTEAETAVGVLKMNSRILEPAELKRLEQAPWNTKSDVCFAWHCIVCAKKQGKSK